MALFDLFRRKSDKTFEEKAKEEEFFRQEKTAAEQREAHKNLPWPQIQPVNRLILKPAPAEEGKEAPKLPEAPVIRDTLSPERKEEVGSLAFEPKLKYASIQDLTLQELLFLLTTIILFNQEAELENFEANRRLVYNEMLNRIRGAEKIYVLFDGATGYPFLDGGFAGIYLEKEKADLAAGLYKAQFRNVRVEERSTGGYENGVVKKGFFDYLFYLGIQRVAIDNGFYRGMFAPGDIVAAPDWQGSAEGSLRNPALNFDILNFLGELRWPVNFPEKKAAIANLQMKVMMSLRQAKFLVPIYYEVMGDEQGKVSLPADKPLPAPSIRGPENKSFLPVFTDGIEYNRRYGKEKAWKPAVLQYPQILKAVRNLDGIVVNDGGMKLVVRTADMDGLEKALREAAEKKAAEMKAGKDLAKEIEEIPDEEPEDNAGKA